MQIQHVHSSKKDAWILIVVALAGLVIAVAAAYHVVTSGLNQPASWILLISLLLYLAVAAIIVYPVSYEIGRAELCIRAGWMHSQIMLSSIEAVSPTRNPASAPALSLDRLRIDYQKNGRPTFILVSPEDKFGFLSGLVRYDEDLELKGDRIVRVSG